jgi:hypothetical protein
MVPSETFVTVVFVLDLLLTCNCNCFG